VVEERAEYVEGFSPGVFKKVGRHIPDYTNMEKAAPEPIAREVEMLIASISEQGAARDVKSNRYAQDKVQPS
jgi:hypothetical protein